MRFALKPCPYCGTRQIDLIDRKKWYEGHCTGCGAKGPSGSTEALAAERWNWRRRSKPETSNGR